MRFEFFCAEKKCNVYMRDNLRAPPWKLVLQWGRQLAMDPTEIKSVSDKLSLRHALGKKPPPPPPSNHIFIIFFPGPDPGQFSNSRMWKKTTPASFRSPFFAQGDIGTVLRNPLSIFMILKFEIFLQVSSTIKIKSMVHFSVPYKHSIKRFSPFLSKI
jgi:hypothetical protein